MKRVESQTLVNGDMSTVPGLVSLSIDVRSMAGFSIQAVWDQGSTPVGSFKLQASNTGSDDDADWDDVENSEKTVSGASGTVLYNVKDAFYDYVRLVYVRTSGGGRLNVYARAKGV